MRTQHRTGRPRGRGGFSMVEVLLVLAILAVALGMYSQTVAGSLRLDPLANETNLAAEATRVAIERLRAVPVERIVASYNDDPADDPEGPGTAPGSRFAVEGLSGTGPGGLAGRIEFPSVDGHVREDVQDAMLGMPRDLSADHLVDSASHDSDWVVLPLRVRIEWRGDDGRGSVRSFEIYTMLARL